MIYLDNAATTWPKPSIVIKAMNRAIAEFGANPGRGGHTMSINTAQQVFDCRQKAADIFGVKECENVVFTMNCTHAVNIVLNGLLKPGDHVICSDLDHNAIMRPLFNLKKKGVLVSTAQVDINSSENTVRNFEKCIGRTTKLIICTHASNVTGERLPVSDIGKMCRDRGILFAVDAAQTAGIVDIDVERDNINFLCMPGHKGLYGPMGTGILIINTDAELDCLITGGTGSASSNSEQPKFLPDRFESGTLNVVGICGLKSGIEFINGIGLETIRRHEFKLSEQLFDGLSGIEGVKLFSQRPDESKNVPLVSMNYKDMPSEDFASLLNDSGIAVRAGLHCAPSAHKKAGTLEQGLVRFCPSAFTNTREIAMTLDVVKRITKM